MAEIAEIVGPRRIARSSPWAELYRKEDWWAIWIGLGMIAVAVALFAGGGGENQQKGRQKSRDLDAKRRSPDSERHRPEHEKRAVLRTMLRKLQPYILKMTPLLGRHRNPFDAAAAREQCDRNGNHSETDPDCPPVFLAIELCPRRIARDPAPSHNFSDFGHEQLHLGSGRLRLILDGDANG